MIYSNIGELRTAIGYEGRLLGLDVGTKTIGISISDATRMIANPKFIIARKSNLKDFEQIKIIIAENKISAIVIGIPLDDDDLEIANATMCKFIRKFAEEFDKYFDNKLRIIFFNERLSSFMARNEMKKINKKQSKEDAVASAIMLQHFCDEFTN